MRVDAVADGHDRSSAVSPASASRCAASCARSSTYPATEHDPGRAGAELVGVQIDTHDDEGRVTDEWVIHPYPDDYVVEAFEGAGTPLSGIWDD